MKVVLNYFGQLRQFADRESESREFVDGATFVDVLKEVAAAYDAGFRKVLFDESGQIRPSVMILVNNVPVDKRDLPALQDNDTVTLLPAIAGG